MAKTAESPRLDARPAAEAPVMPAPGSVAWHRLRQGGVGASEVAMLFGKSPYGSLLDLYIAKTATPEELAARPETVYQRRGTRMEAYLRDEAAARYGWTLAQVGNQVHPEHSFLRSSPDSVLLDEAGNVAALVEVKTSRSRDGWLDPAEDPSGCPENYLLQVAAQMCVGLDWKGEHVFPRRAYVVACVGSLDDLRLYSVDAFPALERRIIQLAGAFWRDHVVPRVPPPFDGGAGGDAILAAAFPFNRIAAKLDDCGPDHPAFPLVVELKRAEDALAGTTREYERVRQELQKHIGDRAGLRGDGFRITWRSGGNGRPFVAKFQPEFNPAGVSP